jgi:hypothetical protein
MGTTLLRQTIGRIADNQRFASSDALVRFASIEPAGRVFADSGRSAKGLKKTKAFVGELPPLMEPPEKKEGSFVEATNANFGGTMSRSTPPPPSPWGDCSPTSI